MSHETQKWELADTQAGWQYWHTKVGWLEIQVWSHPHFDCSFFCPELGYKNYSTHTKNLEEAKKTAMIHVFSRLEKLTELAEKVALSPVPA